MRRQMAGSLGLGGGPGSSRVPALLLPSRKCWEGEGELAQERVVVQLT